MPLKIADIQEFIAVVSLADIYSHEERGRRIEWSDEELAARTFPIINNSMGLNDDGQQYRFRFRARFTDAQGEYVADYEAAYNASEPVEVPQEVVLEFAGKVAFMAVYPYLRASVYGSAARLTLPAPVLGLVRLGEFETGEQLTPDQAQAEFADNKSELAGP